MKKVYDESNKTSNILSDGFKNFIGCKIGSKTVIEFIGMYKKSNSETSVWKTVCDCGYENIVGEHSLVYNVSNVCFKCMHTKRSFCEPLYTDGYITMKTMCGYEYFIDEEDYDIIKPYTWHKHKDGYLRTRYDVVDGKNKYILLHSLILGRFGDKLDDVDHINRQPWDNRKINLRIVSHSENMKNLNKKKSNTSGVVGVSWVKLESRYKAYIVHDKKRLNLGTFKDFDDAVVARLKTELELYGDMSPQKHLFEKYGLEMNA